MRVLIQALSKYLKIPAGGVQRGCPSLPGGLGNLPCPTYLQ